METGIFHACPYCKKAFGFRHEIVELRPDQQNRFIDKAAERQQSESPISEDHQNPHKR